LGACKIDGVVVNQNNEIENSVALRIVLNNIKQHNPPGKIKDNLCFDFVYPIELIYNNTSVATVESLEGLLTILYEETKELFVVSIVMPFEVRFIDNATLTIHSEEAFFTLIEECNIDLPIVDDFFNGCFSFVYPIQVVTNDSITHTIISNETFSNFMQEQMDNWWFEFVFPLSVILEDSNVVVLENDYDLFDVLDACFSCDCELVFEPVCVQYEGESYNFPNECEAFCAGFTSDDIIDCEDDNCSISNLVVDVGECHPTINSAYSLTIDFDYENPTCDVFLVGSADGRVFDFLLSELPVTIPDYSGEGRVNLLILNSNNCMAEKEFTAPNCN